MAWTESRASSDELQRCIRDLVALSTLPPGWQNYDIRQIRSSIVAALISMLDADCNNPKLDPADLRRVHTGAAAQKNNARPQAGNCYCRRIRQRLRMS